MPSSRVHRDGLLVVTFAVAFLLCSASSEKVVNITLYYEGLCYACHDFILHQLHPTYGKLEDYLDVDILPFGNAHMHVTNGTVKIQCQHGPDECYINEVQTCAVKYVHPTRKLLDFVACMLSQNDPTKAGKPCAVKVGTDWGVLDRCSSGPEGAQLLYEMGKRTRNHKPPIGYVPWIEVNGAHNPTIQQKASRDLFGFACELLGPDAPRICKKPHSYYCAA
ncbi:gamma-interferon-inducible lysosomal thiol reductase-like [Dermacentor albipictus]|uniref:gamma-interferon-inducible lysosomal thiol reductase-like n=1 Tax=Dermacentor albipictus TaxID=60249 RepID=UPI0038FC7BF6